MQHADQKRDALMRSATPTEGVRSEGGALRAEVRGMGFDEASERLAPEPVQLTPKAGAAVQRKKLAPNQIADAQQACLKSWASPESVALRKKGVDGAVRGVLEGRKRGLDIDYDDDDVAECVNFLNQYLATKRPTDFDGVLAMLGETGRADYVEYLKSIAWPANKKPAIVYGTAVTTAYYDTAKHVVVLDPIKLHSADEMLDALTFECQNALQRTSLREALRAPKSGLATALVEYQSDKKYVEAITSINKAANIDDLVDKLGIDKSHLTPADYASSKKAHKVERPDRDVLPEQDKRQALWWWKTKGWSDEQRKEVWIAENHGEGVGSSEEIYSH